jgi:ribose/xylose/arabinose/galactoside ABC-type transport system permease subunit
MTIGYGSFLGLPVPIWIMLGFLLVTHVILRYTWPWAARSTPSAATRRPPASRGSRAARQGFTFAYSGLAAALAAMVLTGRLNSAQPSAGVMFELDAIAAVVVGGTSLFGGRGGVFGTLIGALIIGVINNGMNLLNVPSFYQQIVKGGVILAALLIERLVAPAGPDHRPARSLKEERMRIATYASRSCSARSPSPRPSACRSRRSTTRSSSTCATAPSRWPTSSASSCS